jgi:hypothetical protein
MRERTLLSDSGSWGYVKFPMYNSPGSRVIVFLLLLLIVVVVPYLFPQLLEKVMRKIIDLIHAFVSLCNNL